MLYTKLPEFWPMLLCFYIRIDLKDTTFIFKSFTSHLAVNLLSTRIT